MSPLKQYIIFSHEKEATYTLKYFILKNIYYKLYSQMVADNFECTKFIQDLVDFSVKEILTFLTSTTSNKAIKLFVKIKLEPTR